MEVETKKRILIIDDEPGVRTMLCDLFATEYDCQAVGSPEHGIELLRSNEMALVISDINMPGISGLELVPLIVRLAPNTVVIMMSGAQTMETAIEAMRVGAFDYLVKPFDLKHVRLAVRRALEHHDLLLAKQKYENRLEQKVQQRTAALRRITDALQRQITERNRVEERLNYLAYYDLLTELPNRVLFKDRLRQSVALAQRDRQFPGLMLVAIDKLKNINDTLGPAVADELVGRVSQRLRAIMREGDTLGYWGSDEFAFLFTNLEKSEDAIKIVDRIQSCLQRRFDLRGHEVYVKSSIGIVLHPLKGDDEDSLMKNASAALFEARKKGGNDYEFYSDEMNSSALERLTMESNLRRAIEREEFVVHYQPKVDANTWHVVGAEALIRWRHPDRGLVWPAEFIPLAHETGLISAIEDWCLRAVCHQLVEWQGADSYLKSVSANISPRQFQQPDFFSTVEAVLREFEVEPGRLELEVTEGSIMSRPEMAVETLKALKQIGVKISIDDFGTGFSSLAYLKRLPLDILKIDRSFISESTTARADSALVMAIITLAHNLGLRVVAEGVETEQQLNFLRSLNCDEMQGYLFSQPLPAPEFERLLFRDRVGPSVWNYRSRELATAELTDRRFPLAV